MGTMREEVVGREEERHKKFIHQKKMTRFLVRWIVSWLTWPHVNRVTLYFLAAGRSAGRVWMILCFFRNKFAILCVHDFSSCRFCLSFSFVVGKRRCFTAKCVCVQKLHSLLIKKPYFLYYGVCYNLQWNTEAFGNFRSLFVVVESNRDLFSVLSLFSLLYFSVLLIVAWLFTCIFQLIPESAEITSSSKFLASKCFLMCTIFLSTRVRNFLIKNSYISSREEKEIHILSANIKSVSKVIS